MYAATCLLDHFGFSFICVQGPSMMPAIDELDNIILCDHFTTKFWRWPKRNEVIVAQNPFKPGRNIVKRVKYFEGEMAEFYSHKEDRIVQVMVPQGHVWIVGDNLENSKDSRDFGPLSLALV